MSTVRGKKSIPSRIEVAALAVTNTTVLPSWATTAPWDCRASLPVSKDRVLSVPVMGPDTETASAIVLSSSRAPAPMALGPRYRRRRSQLSVVGHPDPAGPEYSATGSWRPKPRGLLWLLAPQTEASDQRPVPLDVVVSDVVEQPAPT